MVDHTLIDVLLANVYLDSTYYKGHCRVMCVSFPIYPVIIGNVRGERRMLPDPDWKAEDQPAFRASTSGGIKDKDNDDDQGGDIPAWMFKKSIQMKTEKSAPKKRDSKKKPAQPKENAYRARRKMKVKEGTSEEECVARPVVTRAQAKARVTYNRPDVYFPMLSNKRKTYTFDCHEEIATTLTKMTTYPQQPYISITSHFLFFCRQVKMDEIQVWVFQILLGN